MLLYKYTRNVSVGEERALNWNLIGKKVILCLFHIEAQKCHAEVVNSTNSVHVNEIVFHNNLYSTKEPVMKIRCFRNKNTNVLKLIPVLFYFILF